MLKATRTYDSSLVKSIMTRPEIWATVAEDGQDPDLYKPEMKDECWLVITNNEEVVGLYRLQGHNAVTCGIHPVVLPEYRNEFSRETGLAALEWVYNSEPDYNKIVAQIPVIYKNVKNFACSFGAKVEGINRESYLKNGEIVDQWLLGITRKEIGELLNG